MIESYQVLSIEQRVDLNKRHHTKEKKVINYYLIRYQQTISHSKEVRNFCLVLRYYQLPRARILTGVTLTPCG